MSVGNMKNKNELALPDLPLALCERCSLNSRRKTDYRRDIEVHRPAPHASPCLTE